jgi:hypothetical protein
MSAVPMIRSRPAFLELEFVETSHAVARPTHRLLKFVGTSSRIGQSVLWLRRWLKQSHATISAGQVSSLYGSRQYPSTKGCLCVPVKAQFKIHFWSWGRSMGVQSQLILLESSSSSTGLVFYGVGPVMCNCRHFRKLGILHVQ